MKPGTYAARWIGHALVGALIAAGVLCGAAARAADETLSAPAAAMEPAADAAAISSEPGATGDAGGKQTELRRDPFWPVGHRPLRPVLVSAAAADGTFAAEPKIPDWTAAGKLIRFQGIVRIGRAKDGKEKFLAVVNRKHLEVGAIVEVEYDSLLYHWKIQAITDKNINLVKLDIRPKS
jgi:hypothetical protein